jgi:hypothetical protein
MGYWATIFLSGRFSLSDWASHWQQRCLRWVICCLLCIHAAGVAVAASTILDTGFESPYVPGPLQGQPASPPTWATAGFGSSTATVQTSIVHEGSQAVQVVKAGSPNTDRRWAVPVSGYPSQRYVIVDWDMRVAQPSSPTGFGPFFGVDTYDAFPSSTPFVLGALGVDARTGHVLYQAQDSGVLTETGSTVAFNQWYHYRLVLDFATDSYRGYFNGALVANTGFVDRVFGLDHFTDADIATFAAAGDPVSQSLSSSAVFDNFVVRDGLLGDYDIAGDVDSGDYTRWRTTYGNTVSPAGNLADGNRNGQVDAGDYVVWRDNLGASLASGAPLGASVVPEPVSCIMLLAVLPFTLSATSRPRRLNVIPPTM